MTARHKPGLWHPLQTVQSGGAVFLFFLVLTILLMVVMLLSDRQLGPNGIVAFEFAGNVDRAREIVQSWEGAPARYAGFSLGIDYLYMVAYSITIAWACIWAGRMVENRRWPFASLGIPLAWGLGLAAVLDALENVALLVQFLVRVAPPWPQVAYAAAGLKFALILAGLLYSVFGVSAWLAARTRPAP
jgi:hypothetical protein